MVKLFQTQEFNEAADKRHNCHLRVKGSGGSIGNGAAQADRGLGLLGNDTVEGLGFLGVKVDRAINSVSNRKEAEISTPDSKVKVFLIPTNEELAIARETKDLL